MLHGKQILGSLNLKLEATGRRKEEACWSKPAAGWVKLNCDGSYRIEDGSAGAGMLLRDEHGQVIFPPIVNYKVVMRRLKLRFMHAERALPWPYNGVLNLWWWSSTALDWWMLSTNHHWTDRRFRFLFRRLKL
jgi:hypothetical protein